MREHFAGLKLRIGSHIGAEWLTKNTDEQRTDCSRTFSL
jgi:hypothetical protein